MATVTVDFADHFWGDKHMGFSVLYQNMKAGHVAVKELSEFLKDRIQLEEDHCKAMSKNLNKMGHYAQSHHNFCVAWTLAKNTLERIGQAQSRLVQNLQELAKEVHKYGDELQKNHRKLKEQETFDAVNLMQTTTTCLQKAKETYTSRCVEFEKLKRIEDCAPKEIAKAENKANKARDEYKQYIEKYSQVRNDFDTKLSHSARVFQTQEENYIANMKALIGAYAKHTEDYHIVSGQVSAEFRESIVNMDTNAILSKFIGEKSTGSERPYVVLFEEPDVASLLPPITSNSVISSDVINHRAQPPTDLNLTVITPSTNDLIKLSPTVDAILPPSEPPPPIPVEEEIENVQNREPTTVHPSHSRSKLTLWLPLRKKNSASTESRTPTETPTGSGAEGFLKKRTKKDKKRRSKESTNNDNCTKTSEHGSVEETRSSASSRSDEKSRDNFQVDEEGFVIRPPENVKKHSKLDSRSSSSSFDSDDENQTKKIKSLTIKPTLDSSEKAPSVDELRDAVGSMTIGRTMGSGLGKSRTFDSDPWAPTTLTSRGPVKLLRPSLTGDDRLNRTFASFGDNFNSNQSVPAPLAASLTGSGVRSRPRSNTPTTMFNITGHRGSESSSGSDMFRADSMGSLSGESSFNARLASSSGFGTTDIIPVAMAVTETVHAYFQKNNTKVRVFGSVQVSLPTSALPVLLDVENDCPPLSFRMVKAERLNALIPNKQVLSADAVSHFSSSESHSFSFDRQGLANFLKKESEQRPGAPFYNIEVLRYEVRNPTAPLLLLSFWKCEAHQTDLRLDYRLNPDCLLEAALLNLQFITNVNGMVENVTAKPEADWSKTSEYLTWRLTELSRHGECSGSLKARMNVSRGPSQPTSTQVQFSASDASLSDTQVELESDGYRLSLLRKKLMSGKYICDPETR